jgi:catechol 2,3-dioxygenase-like lactoylglutathione lyase family enzyme
MTLPNEPSSSPQANGQPLAQHHQLHGVQPVLPVPDIAAAAQWFVRVLGMSVDFLVGEPPVHGRVKAGDGSWGAPIYLHLSQVPDGGAEPIAARHHTQTRLHVGHDIDGLHRHVVAQGAQVLQQPTDQPWGLREMVLLAPGGHALVLGAEVAAPAA